MKSTKKSSVTPLVEQYRKDNGSLVSLLQSIQTQFGYLPKKELIAVSGALEIPVSKLFAIATFYNSFSLEPQGKNTVQVCLGTACHVKNGENLSNMLARELGLEECEGTSSDRAFTLKKVRCLGCCSIAPVVKVNEDVHGYMTQKKVANLLKQYRKSGT